MPLATRVPGSGDAHHDGGHGRHGQRDQTEQDRAADDDGQRRVGARRGQDRRACAAQSEPGSNADAPRPCTARAAIRTPRDGAAAHAAEPTANVVSPSTNTLLAPTRSAVDPAVSMIEARASVKASMTHCRPTSEPQTSRWMTGSATFTIVTSSRITKKPRQTEVRASAAPLVVASGWSRFPGSSGSSEWARPSGRSPFRSCCVAECRASPWVPPSGRLAGPIQVPAHASFTRRRSKPARSVRTCLGGVAKKMQWPQQPVALAQITPKSV